MDEPWWSRGHATFVPSPSGDEWWMIYHGYENGYRTLGRRMLIEPFVWDGDGWPRARGGDLSRPMRKPRGSPPAIAQHALSDDLTENRLDVSLAMFRPSENYLDRIRFDGSGMILQGHGASIGDCSPLALIVGDRSYEVSVEVEIEGAGEAGLLLFYAPPHYCGLGSSAAQSTYHDYFRQPNHIGETGASLGRRFHLRVVNDRNVASFYHSRDGASWRLYASTEVSGYHHNMAGGFMSLRPAIYMLGEGSARFRNLRYAARNA
jgi:xylan 1,4-beta-xylosidase